MKYLQQIRKDKIAKEKTCEIGIDHVNNDIVTDPNMQNGEHESIAVSWILQKKYTKAE